VLVDDDVELRDHAQPDEPLVDAAELEEWLLVHTIST
jgi:hypothetical protein